MIVLLLRLLFIVLRLHALLVLLSNIEAGAAMTLGKYRPHPRWLAG